MKKILATLVSFAIFSSSATSVVSCGPITFETLMNRRMPTDVYRGTYNLPISSWSSAVTMQLDDAIILTNTQDTLLATDQHNNFEGDLADAWETDDTSTIWRFHVRDDQKTAAHWTTIGKNNEQIDQGMIKSIDFFNTFRFLFNPNNMSQTVGILQGVINYGSELNKFIVDIRTEGNPLYNSKFVKQHQDRSGEIESSYYLDRAILAFNISPEDPSAAQRLALDKSINNEQLVDKSFAEGKIVNNSPKNKDFNLEFNLSKPTPYFESMAAFLAFAPLPNVAVDYLSSNLSGTNYGSATKDGKFGYQNIYYSGPYVATDYNPTLRITLEKNSNYFNAKNVSINKLLYSYAGNVDVSRRRFYFETGDISEVDINPNDLAGWNKYVGSNPKNPRFDGTNFVYKPQIGTMALAYNYNSTLPNADASNIALAQRSTRGFIRYVLDRSKIASYYSKAMDQGPTSSVLRNNWTSKNLAFFKDEKTTKDYVQYIEENYYKNDDSATQTVASQLKNGLQKWGLSDANYQNWSKKYGEVEVDGKKINALNDGYDGLLRNDLLGALVFTDDNLSTANGNLKPRNEELFRKYVNLIGKYDAESENQKFSLLKTQLWADFQKYGITNQVNLKWLADGTSSTTINNNTKDAVRSFNQIVGANSEVEVEKSPIRLEVIESADSADFRTKMQNR